jgi:peptide/nickel transport system substrate-binding protein
MTGWNWKRLMVAPLLLGVGTMAVSLTACAPPPEEGPKSSTLASVDLPGQGKAIQTVQPQKKPPFRTVEMNGVELLEARGEVGRHGGTFTVGQAGEGPKTFNPWAAFDATSSAMGNMLFAGLMDTDAYTGEVVPALAKSLTISPDHLTYTVVLRKGLVWSDGHPLTSKDVEFTWNTIIKQGLGNPSQRDVVMVKGQFPEVKALDPLTIQFRTPLPFAPFQRVLGQQIAPAHIFEPIVKAGGDAAFSATWGPNDAFKHPEKIVSSGMWLLDRYEPGQRVVFKRNPKFFMVDKKGQRLPYIDRYVITFVKDLNNEQLQFEQGRLDTYTVPAQFVARTRNLTTPDFKLYDLGPTTTSTYITFNLNRSRKNAASKPVVDPIKAEWFNNLQFRQAVDWAINREELVRNILRGVGQPLFTPEALNSIYLNRKLAEGHPQDLEKARQLLKAGGFRYDADGNLLDARGRRVSFNLYTNTGNDQREATGVAIQQDLKRLGIQVNFKPMEFNVLIQKLNDADWEAVVLGLTGGTLEPNNGANVWRSSGGLHLFNQRPLAEVRKLNGQPAPDRLAFEKALDDVFDEGATTFDPVARKAVYDRYQQIVVENLPMIYLYSPRVITAVKSRVKNVDPTPLGGVEHNLAELWLEDAGR